jgi:UDP-2,4-diacetamido-2,4,6-trideoxy-beta-L-altropyranose hydrolase
MSRGIILFRADATVTFGTGHVMRCLALAQVWQEGGGEAAFIMAQSTPSIRERLRSERINVIEIEGEPGGAEDLRQTLNAVRLHNAEWIVVDGYNFHTSYLIELRTLRPLLLIDDNGEIDFYSTDLVLNQNPHARTEMYAKRAPHTRMLLGSQYALLRSEFTAYRSWIRDVALRGKRILLTIGGSDPTDLTPRLLSLLSELPVPELQIRVVVGGSATNLDAVAKIVAKSPDRIEVLSNVSNMAELMAWADLAVAGAGTTCWEMCLLGLPAIVFVVAENQRSVAEHLAKIGAVINAGDAESIGVSDLGRIVGELLEDADRRQRMSRVGTQLVDGLGGQRVRAALVDRQINLRLARPSDCRLLFEWATDPVSRAASFHSSAISWEDHSRWFAERLQDSHSVIYIGERATGEPVGLVRFQMKDDCAVLSVNVAAAFRGRGWGRELIVFCTHALVRDHAVRRILAFVKTDNQASRRLFEASGFRRTGSEQVSGQEALRFTWECGSPSHAE